MGTTANHCIVFGYRLPFFSVDEIQEKHNDLGHRLEKVIDKYYISKSNNNKLIILYDGRDGNYVMVGTLISRSADDMDLEEIVEIDKKDIKVYKKLLDEHIKKLQEELPEYFSLEACLEGQEPKVIVLTNLR